MKAAAVLCGVAETLNFTAADEKLCLSQPTVSAQSAALEAELAARRHELEALIKREEYEQAAVCRDRINQLKAELERCPDAGTAAGEGANA